MSEKDITTRRNTCKWLLAAVCSIADLTSYYSNWPVSVIFMHRHENKNDLHIAADRRRKMQRCTIR